MVDGNLRESLPTYTVVGKFLFAQIMAEVMANRHPVIFDEYPDTDAVLGALHLQFAAYTRHQHPFCFAGWEKLTLREYWKRLLDYPNANLLAVRLFICEVI